MVHVLIANGAHANFFEAENKFSHLKHLKHLDHAHDKTHDHERDRQGRTFEKSDSHRYSYEPKSDWHERQKHIFAKELAHIIVDSYKQKIFNELILICPPHIIGDIKSVVNSKLDHLSLQELKLHIIEKDLTHHTTQEIETVIANELI